MKPEDVKVAHFSGGPKVWKLTGDSPDTYWINKALSEFSSDVTSLALHRQQVLHKAWRLHFESALKLCQKQWLPWRVPENVQAEMQLPRDFLQWVQTPPPPSAWPQEASCGGRTSPQPEESGPPGRHAMERKRWARKRLGGRCATPALARSCTQRRSGLGEKGGERARVAPRAPLRATLWSPEPPRSARRPR